jgi:hypothetical protein
LICLGFLVRPSRLIPLFATQFRIIGWQSRWQDCAPSRARCARFLSMPTEANDVLTTAPSPQIGPLRLGDCSCGADRSTSPYAMRIGRRLYCLIGSPSPLAFLSAALQSPPLEQSFCIGVSGPEEPPHATSLRLGASKTKALASSSAMATGKR